MEKYTEHIQFLKDEDTYSCNICDEQYVSTNMIYEHVATHFPNDDTNVEEEDEQTDIANIDEIIEMAKAVSEQNPSVSDFVSDQITSKNEASTDVSSTNNENTLTVLSDFQNPNVGTTRRILKMYLSCLDCGAQFSTSNDIIVHTLEAHPKLDNLF